MDWMAFIAEEKILESIRKGELDAGSGQTTKHGSVKGEQLQNSP
jgi:hypothetical protein